MVMQNKANQYRQTAVVTASREQILIMLYEGAIRFVRKAVECVERKDYAGKGMAIGKAHDIINELLNTLDFNVGGNIARDLERLYNFMVDQLIDANSNNKTEPLLVVQKNLETLLEGWKEAVAQVKKGQAEK